MHDDPDEIRRYTSAFTSDHPIPTIKRYQEEKETRREAAGNHEEHAKDVAENFMYSESGRSGGGEAEGAKEQNTEEQQDPGAQQSDDKEDPRPAVDTSEADPFATDPRQRRKELKKRKDERAEREVTDPVTHLPVTIHDFTSEALEKVPENQIFDSTAPAGFNNYKKSAKQLRDEIKRQQQGHDSTKALFPPPEFDISKQELQRVHTLALTVVVLGGVVIGALLILLEGYVRRATTSQDTIQRKAFTLGANWAWILALGVAAIWGLIALVQEWTAKKIHTIWEDQVWEASDRANKNSADAHQTETVAWLNALLGSVWPLVNPDLFTSLADTLEDVMQASLPRMVQMVSVNDIGQGSESIRILGVRWLPTGAAARSVTEDGKFKSDGNRSNDRKVSGQGAAEDPKDNGAQQTDDGSQEEIAEGLEAEEGDFVNMEIAFAYRAKSSRRSLKDRARDMHMYIAFYLPGTIKVPVWVDLRGLVGTMRIRMQLCPDPPFFSLCTITFLGQPKVDISCTPLSRHALNIMDVPFISNFVQSAVDAAMAQYVAPKSLNIDLKDMISGEDFKKDTNSRGVLVVNIRRGYDFRTGDQGIPMIKDGSSDPYVSVGWAKFGKPVWSTRLLLDEMQPWWDETAYVLVTPEELNVNERLRVQLWDSDRLTADDDLGRIEVSLKELMGDSRSKGQMWQRSDGFKALKAGESMPGKLEWSVGYFAKTEIQDSELQRQTYDPEIKNMDQLRQKVDEICQRKLREANVKEGRHKQEANELEQQRAQEMKAMEDAMIISAPPPDGYPSGIFSIQIHQITGLELEKISKTQTDKEGEMDDEEEEGEGLPSAYCTVIINHSKVFKTRTKPKNAKPFYNASTERFAADWRNTEVFVSVRDARVKEDDPLLGIVHLPLGEVFKERSQINGLYPLAGGVGFGHIRLSMVWRSVQLQAPPEALGWDYGTVEVRSGIPPAVAPKDLQRLKLKFHTDLGSGKMYSGKEEEGWNTKNKGSLMLAVRKRYSTCLSVQFLNHGVFSDRTAAFGVLWLREIPDGEEREVTLTVWKGDFERAVKNALPEPGEKIGSIKLKVAFWEGLGAAHSRWASKDHNVREVIEVLDTARDNLETMHSEERAGIVDGNASDSSDDENNQYEDHGHEGDGIHEGILDKAKHFKKHHGDLNKQNRGIMQWKIPRTAQWAKHKAQNAEEHVTGLFKHQTKGAGIETEA